MTSGDAGTDVVRVDRADGVGELVIDRPERRNALNGAVVEGLQAGLQSLVADPSVRVVVIRGEGGTLCAGLDLKELAASPPPPWRAGFGDAWATFHMDIWRSDKPIVGALEGAAIAGGAALAFACDFLVCGHRSRLQVSEVARGMIAPLNVAWLVAKYGHARAVDLVVGAASLSGDDLWRLGIAAAVVDDPHVLSAARELAGRLAAHDAGAVARSKAMIRSTAATDFPALVGSLRGDPGHTARS